jgi:hypothetical protein
MNKSGPTEEASFTQFNLPEPDVIAAEIADDLQAALEQFAQITADLREPISV